VTTALYRRYRPETFADVIGQEHVTDPLRQALRADRVTHAYLFSGPRVCGKTTSARILARCLNCVEGPTDTPCGTCDSCVDLAREGSGSLDVVEIDAASHNGVDDARELRERALFAPARDRYKIFILDEAHMVTSQGFNALLKLVEEPPPHVKFVFATTEPEKVIGTIRSRTHHYPFRLVPPEALINYLEFLCEKENVQVGRGVLPLVVRAGGGSVRDTLSVLDQLIAGAGEAGVDYDLAATLLGYTPDSLLDDVVSAIAARDGASVFQIIDRVIESGHDPRRFVEDLLERLRDLVVIAAAGEHAEAVMRGIPGDQLQRMRSQSSLFSPADLSRSADITNEALSDMTGATSPRLHLELLCARLLLVSGQSAPAQSTPTQSMPAQSTPAHSAPVVQPASPAPAASKKQDDVFEPARPTEPEVSSLAESAPTANESSQESAPAAEEAPPAGEEAPPAVEEATSRGKSASEETARAARPANKEQPESESPAPSAPQRAAGIDANTLRQRWPEVLETLSRLRRVTWVLVSQNAQVVDVTETSVRLEFTTQALANTFVNGPHPDHVREAIGQTLGVDLVVEPVTGSDSKPSSSAGGSTSGSASSSTPRDSRPTSWDSPSTGNDPAPASSPESRAVHSTGDQARSFGSAAQSGSTQSNPTQSGLTQPSSNQPGRAQSSHSSPTHAQSSSAQPSSTQPQRGWESAGTPSKINNNGEDIPDNVRTLPTAGANALAPEDFEPSDDDEILEDSDSVGVPLVQREMGGEIIEEIEE